jgi:glutamine cyclotransferase
MNRRLRLFLLVFLASLGVASVSSCAPLPETSVGDISSHVTSPIPTSAAGPSTSPVVTVTSQPNTPDNATSPVPTSSADLSTPAVVTTPSHGHIPDHTTSPIATSPAEPSTDKAIPVYTYRIVNTYPHDPNAFTQGLVFEDGMLYEGTGLRGRSTLRKVALESGNVLQLLALPDQFFAEGVTVYGDKIIQLTWHSHVGFVYDKDSFELLRTFNYPTEGWGITHDGQRLIMSDGTSTLYFLDPETFEQTGQIEVRDNAGPVTGLNELEYVQGEIYANVWKTERIARIDPRTGQVIGWIALEGLLRPEDRSQPVDVLNGIAYDAAHDRLFVTGKWWPKLFEIELIPLE